MESATKQIRATGFPSRDTRDRGFSWTPPPSLLCRPDQGPPLPAPKKLKISFFVGFRTRFVTANPRKRSVRAPTPYSSQVHPCLTTPPHTLTPIPSPPNSLLCRPRPRTPPPGPKACLPLPALPPGSEGRGRRGRGGSGVGSAMQGPGHECCVRSLPWSLPPTLLGGRGPPPLPGIPSALTFSALDATTPPTPYSVAPDPAPPYPGPKKTQNQFFCRVQNRFVTANPRKRSVRACPAPTPYSSQALKSIPRPHDPPPLPLPLSPPLLCCPPHDLLEPSTPGTSLGLCRPRPGTPPSRPQKNSKSVFLSGSERACPAPTPYSSQARSPSPPHPPPSAFLDLTTPPRDPYSLPSALIAEPSTPGHPPPQLPTLSPPTRDPPPPAPKKLSFFGAGRGGSLVGGDRGGSWGGGGS